MSPGVADAEGGRRIERRRRHEARRQGRRRSGRRRPAAASPSSGRARAITAPMPPPMARPQDDQEPSRESRHGGATASVVTMAMRHADHAEGSCRGARSRARQPAQRQDEEDARRRGRAAGRGRPTCARSLNASWRRRLAPSLGRYMASMRWVTRKPPKMLIGGEDEGQEAEGPRPDRARIRAHRRSRRRRRAARRRRSPRRWRWSPTSAACAAPASPTRRRSSRRRSPARRWRSGRRRDRSRRPSPLGGGAGAVGCEPGRHRPAPQSAACAGHVGGGSAPSRGVAQGFRGMVLPRARERRLRRGQVRPERQWRRLEGADARSRRRGSGASP